MNTGEWKIIPYDSSESDPSRLLQQTLSAEEISGGIFARKVLLDPNFDPAGALVAMDGEWMIGFVLALMRRYPLEDAPEETGRGWITLFAVDRLCRRQGVGTALLHAAEAWLRTQGCTEVWISPYAPGYWTPGVDEVAYPEAIAFLQQRGYTVRNRPLSMALSLADWRVPEWARICTSELSRENVRCENFVAAWSWPLTEFLRREFPGDWQRHARATMLDILAGRRPSEELIVAYEIDSVTGRRTVLGFAQCEGERFGPFGVAVEARGRGVGALLLYKMLESMQRRGLHRTWFMWGNDATAERLYHPAGFRETRRFAVLSKPLV